MDTQCCPSGTPSWADTLLYVAQPPDQLAEVLQATWDLPWAQQRFNAEPQCPAPPEYFYLHLGYDNSITAEVSGMEKQVALATAYAVRLQDIAEKSLSTQKAKGELYPVTWEFLAAMERGGIVVNHEDVLGFKSIFASMEGINCLREGDFFTLMSKEMAKIVPQEVRTIPPFEPRIRVPIQLTAVALDIPKSVISSTIHVDRLTGVLRVKYPKKKHRHWVTFQAEAVCIPPEQTFKVGRPSQTAAEAGLKSGSAADETFTDGKHSCNASAGDRCPSRCTRRRLTSDY